MCQIDLSTFNFRNYTCGQVEQPTWTVQQEDPYVFTVVYNNGPRYFEDAQMLQ